MRSTLTHIGSVATGLSLAGLLMAGCGSTAQAAPAPAAPDTATAAMPGMAMTPTSVTAANAADAKVLIDSYKFGPDKLTVPVGTTVTWTNNDADEHTVVAKDETFRSGSLAKGQSFQYTFSKAGSYDYLCSIHPFMVATVVVTG
ncbi:MAG TPA: cupredoxin family copper-binding protein [Sporichthyaceae bacterium]